MTFQNELHRLNWLHKEAKTEIDRAVKHLREAQKLQDEIILFIRQRSSRPTLRG